MEWKDFWFGVVSTLGAEFVLAVIGLAVALLKTERATNKLLGKRS